MTAQLITCSQIQQCLISTSPYQPPCSSPPHKHCVKGLDRGREWERGTRQLHSSSLDMLKSAPLQWNDPNGWLRQTFTEANTPSWGESVCILWKKSRKYPEHRSRTNNTKYKTSYLNLQDMFRATKQEQEVVLIKKKTPGSRRRGQKGYHFLSHKNEKEKPLQVDCWCKDTLTWHWLASEGSQLLQDISFQNVQKSITGLTS